MTVARQRQAGQLPLDLSDSVAQEIQDYRRSRMRQGLELPRIDQEAARRFGPDLGSFGMDEVGTPSLPLAPGS